MTGNPAFWVLVIAFGAIFLGVACSINRQMAPFDTSERLPFGLIVAGIAGVVLVTAAKVLS